MIVNILLSILLGMIPETLFFTLFLTYTKNLKNKRIKLFLLISLAYVLCVILMKYNVLFYILFVIGIYLSLKILYKNKIQIIDIFIISIGFIYICIISFVFSKFINNNYYNYYILLFINKIFLFLPFIFKNKFNLLYKRYCSLWNRNDNIKRPIKSITLRNISLVILNVFIFILDILTVYVINTFS